MKSFLRRNSSLISWLAVGLIAAALLLLFRALPLTEIQQAFQRWLEGLGAWGPLLFVAMYVVATVLFFPGSVFTLVAGAAFGLGLGFLLVSAASTLGAALAFLTARYLARGKVEAMARRYPRFRAIDAAIAEGGWKVVAMLRLSPAIPFNAQNYLYGLTDVPFMPYVLASWIAMMPGTFLYVYLGHIAGAAAAGEDRSGAEWALLVIGLTMTVGVTVYVTRLARKHLRTQPALEGGDEAAEREESGTGLIRTIMLATGALSLLAVAIAAQFQTEWIESWLGPWLRR